MPESVVLHEIKGAEGHELGKPGGQGGFFNLRGRFPWCPKGGVS